MPYVTQNDHLIRAELKLHGVIPPLVTPFDREGAVYELGVHQLVDYVVGAGVHGVFVAGTTGEATSLDAQDVTRLVKATSQAANGRLPVLVGVTMPSTGATIERAKLAVEGGADIIVAHPPYYYAHSQKELISFYKTLARGSSVPVVIYNIPQTTKLALTNATVEELALSEPNIIGIKDSSNNLEDFRRLTCRVKAQRPDFSLLLGSDVLLDAALLMGADGTVPSLSNLFPQPLCVAYRAAREGRWQEAAHQLEKVTRLTGIYRAGSESAIGSTIASLKYGLNLMGIEVGLTRPPLSGLNEDGQQLVKRIVEEFEPTLSSVI